MLSVFTNDLTTTQSELDTLLAKVEALRGQMKSLKATQNKALKVIDSLKSLLTELPATAINELKKEILSLFPNDSEPIADDGLEPYERAYLQYEAASQKTASVQGTFTNFVTEVPKAEVETQSWNPADFELMEYQVKDNGHLNLLQPATDDDDQWPEVETAIAKVNVSELCFYLRQPNQEIVAAYFAVANRNVGKEWADYLNLMGCVAEVRKAERFNNGVRWEVKATRIPHELILQVDKARSSLYSALPHGNQEYTKKSLSGKDEIKGNSKDSKTPAVPSNLQPESLEITTEQNLVIN